ncbi:MAG TPA: RQC domain-containing protein, partial [Pyrinomonadaceae bacterium]|nr:RQC domain-containing protein [Pyrinomonadaceae bacterium]
PLTDDELLRVRKILACAKRMNGRFGKKILAATLRGSASKQVMNAGLNELSTYGLLKDMLNDEIQFYIDALIVAGCLKVKGGAYPTISNTDLGDRVMREQEQITLALS